jgi:hypothetical protein
MSVTEGQKCCEHPDVIGRWYYVGADLKGAVAYCKNCDAKWELSAARKALVRE